MRKASNGTFYILESNSYFKYGVTVADDPKDRVRDATRKVKEKFNIIYKSRVKDIYNFEKLFKWKMAGSSEFLYKDEPISSVELLDIASKLKGEYSV